VSKRDVTTHPPQKILILRFSSLGDIVMATALIRVIRTQFPSAQIDMVVREDFLDLIRFNPHLNHKIGLSRKKGLKGLLDLRRQINREHYDIIYDAHRSLRTLFLMPTLRAKKKVYFQKHYVKRSLALTFKFPLLRGLPRTLQRYIEPLHSQGVKYDGRGPEIFLSDEVRKKALEKVPLPKNREGHWIGIVPSAQWPGKRWPIERFGQLVARIVEETSHSVIVFGGKEDVFCHEIVRGLPAARAVNAQGKLSIAESGALLEHCSLVIANDTGLMHMADALNKPSLLFLGPTSEELGCLPFHPKSVILEHKLWCRPCSKNGEAPCIRSQRFCLTLTSVDRAFAGLHEILRRLKDSEGTHS
jgi:ADP-heptose:LPS heptosyltransferase